MLLLFQHVNPTMNEKNLNPKNVLKAGPWLIIAVLLVFFINAGRSDIQSTGLKGSVKVDGSSTVFPVTEAVGEEFQLENKDVRVTIGSSGTGGGFEKFIGKEIDVCDASRPIKDEEKKAAEKAGIDYIELEVAYDGLSVVVNKGNAFVNSLTTQELKKIWKPKSKVKKWSDIRSTWPDKRINLYGPGTDSGTFDYFTKTIMGEEGASRPDYTSSEDDNVLVQGITRDKHGLGYFGFAYYEENKDRLKLVAVDAGKGPVYPSRESVSSNTYAPLSRPLYVYVRTDSLKRPEIKAFIKYFLNIGPRLVEQVGYVKVPVKSDKENRARLNKALGSPEEVDKK